MASIGTSGSNEVFDRLWLGNLADAENASTHHITHILTIASGLKYKPPLESICHHVFEVDDHPCADILAILPQACEALDESLSIDSNSVLVHCVSGVSRSTTVIIAWLMTRKGFRLNDALDLIKSSRLRAQPNPGFMVALETLESMNCDFIAASEALKASDRCILNSVLDDDDRGRLLNQIGNFRDLAMNIHKKIDNIENLLGVSGCGLPDNETRETLLQLQSALLALQTQAQSQVDDKVAKRLRKSGFDKIQRLLDNGV